MTDGNYVVRVVQQSAGRGKIYVKCPDEYSDGFINVIVSDGAGYSFVKVISFYESRINVVEDVDTRTAMQRRTLKLSVEQNNGDNIRKGQVRLYYENTDDAVYETITITQSSACFSIEKTDFLVPAEGKTYEVALTSSRGVKVSVPESDSWISASCRNGSSAYEYVLTLTAVANESLSKRASDVSVYSSDGNTLLATLELIQLGDATVNPDEMILTMRVNYSNDFTAYLPIFDEADCPAVEDFGAVFARTAITEIPEELFAACPEVKDFTYAFSNCKGLKTLPEALFASNRKVSSFSYTFDDCSSLEEIPVGLFDKCRMVIDFTSTFEGCHSMKGESPYTMIDGVKYHLYERHLDDEQFLTPEYVYDCFLNCKGLSDYSEIPSSWK